MGPGPIYWPHLFSVAFTASGSGLDMGKDIFLALALMGFPRIRPDPIHTDLTHDFDSISFLV